MGSIHLRIFFSIGFEKIQYFCSNNLIFIQNILDFILHKISFLFFNNKLKNKENN